jgi:hypothetical protein
MTDNVDVAVIGAELEENVLWTVPLVDYFLYEIFASTQLKANRPFVALPAGIAVNLQLHLIIVAQNRLVLSRPTRCAAGIHGSAPATKRMLHQTFLERD